MQIYNNRNEKPFWELRETGCEQNDRIFCIYPKKNTCISYGKAWKTVVSSLVLWKWECCIAFVPWLSCEYGKNWFICFFVMKNGDFGDENLRETQERSKIHLNRLFWENLSISKEEKIIYVCFETCFELDMIIELKICLELW